MLRTFDELSGLREGKGRCFTFLRDAKYNDETLVQVRQWLLTVGHYVAIRDCLALSFALDYDRKEGNPAKPQTIIGALRSRAKPYAGGPTSDTFAAADELTKACLEFIENVNCYRSADAVVAMPPSDPGKPFNLPYYLSGKISKALGIANLSNSITTISARKGLKDVPLESKLQTLEGTISVESGSFEKQIVILIDDLYQSGVSMNYAAMLMLEAGAKKVFGLACEKTCSNDDNIQRR